MYPRNEGVSPAGFINERARLTLEYERKRLSLRFSAQHVGVWGQDALIDKNGRFILNEAWAALGFNGYWFMQLGRQSLVYDVERMKDVSLSLGYSVMLGTSTMDVVIRRKS